MRKENEKTIYLAQLPGGPAFQKSMVILLELGSDGKTYAKAPELGLWVDGVGNSEAEAIEDLAGVVRRYQDSLDGIGEGESYEYLQTMKSAFNALVLGR